MLYAIRIFDDNGEAWYYSVNRPHTKDASGHWYNFPIPHTPSKGEKALVYAKEIADDFKKEGYHYYEAPDIKIVKRMADNKDYLNFNGKVEVVELQEIHYYEVKQRLY